MTALAKARRRLIPFLFLLYIVSYLDRINVGFAALQMNQALGLSATAFGLGAGIFFLSYALFEIPSNVILARVGARRWIARIMLTWGIASAAMMFAKRPMHFYALRFLLGAAEAGFFPGVIYYLTMWFPRRERARTVAAFMTATLAAGIIGGPVSGSLLTMWSTVRSRTTGFHSPRSQTRVAYELGDEVRTSTSYRCPGSGVNRMTAIPGVPGDAGFVRGLFCIVNASACSF